MPLSKWRRAGFRNCSAGSAVVPVARPSYIRSPARRRLGQRLMLHMLSSLLGLDINGASRTITLRSPRLPRRAGEIRIRNMRVGEGSADFTLRTRDGTVTLDVESCRAGSKGRSR